MKKLLRSYWVRSIIAIIALLLFVCASIVYLMYPGIGAPSEPDFQTPSDQTEANRQDISYLRETILEMDRSFSEAERREFNAVLDRLYSRADSLSTAELEMGMAESVARSGNGHTNVIGSGWGLTLNSTPVRFYWFDDGLYILKAERDYQQLLGGRVVALGGHTPDQLVERLRRYTGGRPTLQREFAVNYMQSPQALNAIGLIESPTELELTVEMADGEIRQRTLPAIPVPVSGPAPEQTELTRMFDPREMHWPRRELSPVPRPATAPFPVPTSDGREWRHVLDGRRVPFTLSNPNRFYWATELEGGRVLFVQLNATMDDPQQGPLRPFLDAILDRVARGDVRHVIVDMRSNLGGSYQLPATFTEELPKRLPASGRVYILTSPNTYSAGVVTTARLKYFSGDRGYIVGQPVGDFSQFWAEAATRIVLPNSGLRVGYATGYHDWEHGCSLSQILYCYLPNYIHGVAAGSLDPDIRAEMSFEDYLGGRDTVLDVVLRSIGMDQQQSVPSDEPGVAP